MDSNSESESLTISRRLFWAALLSLEFVAIYTACNFFTSTRADVGQLYLEWELAIPLIPWLIIPYMSIDLFFAASFFVPKTRSEFMELIKRLALAPLIAAPGFLLLPLELGFERKVVDGTFGPVFAFLFSFDQPHNLFPSLHIAYNLILRRLYGWNTRGAIWWVLQGWFVLVSLSTLFTHQHHIIDVIGGGTLGIVIFYLIPDIRSDEKMIISEQPSTRPQHGWCYLTGSLVSVFLIFVLFPWGIVFLWPAFSLFAVSLGYFKLGPIIFRKTDGRLHFSAKVLLAPYLVGLYLSRRYFWSKSEPFDRITDEIYLGRVLSESEAKNLLQRGVRSVLDLTGEHECPPSLRAINYRNIQVLDLTTPGMSDIKESIAFLSNAPGPVYVFCGLGMSRSAAVTAAYLAHSGTAKTYAQAIEMIKRSGRHIVLPDRDLREGK